ncbi:MAG: VWA domain-containing protein, partial [Candidatus Omnitrophica bacterium]|nr:VWA domain-containing protein [Candidatus Omnitrophota bacterium]
MKVKKSIFSSIILSVLIHVLLLSGVAGIKVTAEHSQEIRQKTKKFFDVKTIQKDVVIKKPVRRKEIVYVDSLKFEKPGFTKSINKMVEDEQTIKKEDDAAEKKEDIELVNKLKSQAIDDLKENEKNKVEFRKKTQRETADDIISDEELDVEQMIFDQKEFLKQEEVPKDFYEKMPGFTPERSTGMANLQKGDFLSTLIQGHSPVIRRAASIEDIRKELVWSYSTYQDPEDGQKYFKISIGATRSNVSLVKIPKEIIFLIDCSISIEQDRLEEFKKGISYCLKHLNEEDRFNIMAFKEVTTKFKSSSVNPTQKNIEDALDFVGNLKSGEKTDTYNALLESINVKDAMTPSYIFLLSDGRPTKGVVNSRKVINKISALNKGKISIFAF